MKKKSPRFSVLMSIYKNDSSLFLLESLKSLVDQTLLPDQLILVNDGYITADLEKVQDEFKSKAPFDVIIIKLKTNKGLGFALKVGLKYCKYKWVARMDSDDISIKDRFEKQFNYLKKKKYAPAVVGGLIQEFESNKMLKIRYVPENFKKIKSTLKYRSPVNHVSVIFNKKIILKVGSYQTFHFLEDYHLWARIISNGYTINNIQSILVLVRAGQNMINRRRGFIYALNEIKLLKYLHNLGIINYLQFCIISIIKFSIRLLPSKILSFVYKIFLRG